MVRLFNAMNNPSEGHAKFLGRVLRQMRGDWDFGRNGKNPPTPTSPARPYLSPPRDGETERAWARRNKIEVGDRGRISGEIRHAYQEALSRQRN
ncbi:Lsr2 family protein [Mycobacterium riyadhense]|nr:Lsr2 family protein [Mycobacterium riyadhense]